MANFPAGLVPNYGIREKLSGPRVLISTHADGTEQRREVAPGGQQEFELVFESLSQDEYDDLVEHWDTQHGTSLAFEWVHPDRNTTYSVRYLSEPEFTHEAYDSYQATVRFRVFGVVVVEEP